MHTVSRAACSESETECPAEDSSLADAAAPPAAEGTGVGSSVADAPSASQWLHLGNHAETTRWLHLGYIRAVWGELRGA